MLYKIVCIASFVFFYPATSAVSVYAQQNSDRNAAVDKALSEGERAINRKKIEEELTRPSEKKPSIEIPETKAPEETKLIPVKKIALEGCKSFSADTFSPLISKYENRQLSFSQLKNLAQEIEGEYLKRGIIAAVIIPGQELKDGLIIFKIVEAKMGAVEIQDHKYYKNERIRKYWMIPPGDVIRYSNVSQSLQLMNKNPDRNTKARMRAGAAPETTDVYLQTESAFPVHGLALFDNDGSTSSGKSRQSYGLRDNNLLGLDDIFLYGYNFGRDYNGFYAYHNIPINYRGTYLLYGYSESKSEPTKEFAALGLKSKAESATVSLHQDLFTKGDYLGEVFVEMTAKDKTISEDTGVLNRDRLRIFGLGGNFFYRELGSTLSLSPKFSQGIDAFGASPDDNPLASREAPSVFSKLELDLRYKKMLPLNLQASVRFRGQVASEKLTPQEEYSLGGMDSNRGYPASDFLADNAVNNNLELLFPAVFIPGSWRLPYADNALRNQTTGVVFLDQGWGMRKGSNPSEKNHVNMLSAGVGMRFNFFNQALLRVEWGFPLGDKSITEGGNSRFHFSIEVQENFLQKLMQLKQRPVEEAKTAYQTKREFAMDKAVKNTLFSPPSSASAKN